MSDSMQTAPTQTPVPPGNPGASPVAAMPAVEFRSRALEFIARREPLEKSLNALVQEIEKLGPGIFFTVHRYNETSNHLTLVAKHGLPDEFCESLQTIQFDPRQFSIGGAAVKREKVDVADLAINPLTSSLRTHAAAARVQSCSSIPLLSAPRLLGVLTVFDSERMPQPHKHDLLLKNAGELAVIAIEAEQERDQLAELSQKVDDLKHEIQGLHLELDAGKNALVHDIRAPLKVLLNNIQQMMESATLRGDHSAHEGLEKMRINAMRVEHVIADLLKISALTRSDLKYEDIDLTKLATRTARDVGEKMNRLETKVLVQQNMKVHADPQFLELIFDNLIANAMRLTIKTPNPSIEVGVSESSGRKAFYVRDNGPGIHPHHLQRIFEPIERLQAERDYPGSGLALNTVKRLVERHGGRAWALGGIGKGCTFAFTIADDSATAHAPT